MSDQMAKQEVLDSIQGTHDSLSVKRCYGDPIELDGVTVIPVARASGGAGGGGGEGTDEHDAGGGGFGTGFGLRVNPIGVYEVHADGVVWKPTVDVNRLLKGSSTGAGRHHRDLHHAGDARPVALKRGRSALVAPLRSPHPGRREHLPGHHCRAITAGPSAPAARPRRVGSVRPTGRP